MFWLKFRGKRLNIREDNVYTRCPNCGMEHAVDLQEILSDGESDLYGTAVYCDDCAAKRVAPYPINRPKRLDMKP